MQTYFYEFCRLVLILGLDSRNLIRIKAGNKSFAV